MSITVQAPRGPVRTVTLATLATRPAGRLDELVAPRGVATPSYLRDVDRRWTVEPLPQHGALYVQMNNVLNDSAETLEQFGRRLRTVLDTMRATSVILDLRHNNGGNPRYHQVVRSLSSFTQLPGHRLYVLIGRRTCSAAAMFISNLQMRAEPIFVGEASRQCCNLAGDPAVLTLPYSRIGGDLTAVIRRTGSEPWDTRREMSPDVPVQLTAKAYFAGEDPALEAVFRLIAASRAPGSGGGARRGRAP